MTDDFNTQPELNGSTLLLRPLRAEDFEALYRVAADPLVWAQHPSPLRYQQEVFEREYFESAMSSGSLLVLERATGRVAGCSRYYDWNPQGREVAIGYTFLGRAYWGGASNGEMKQLMITHAWQWADRIWFHIGRHNLRSRRAAEKIGAVLSHEGEKILNGVVHDYAFYFIDRDMAGDHPGDS